jgi:dihydroorotate dehydrogenase
VIDGLYRRVLRPVLFSLPPETAHALGMAALRIWGRWTRRRPVDDPRLRVTLGAGADALTFDTPVGLAAGFDKDGEAVAGLAALGFGFLEVGTVTPRPQPGNAGARLFRFPAARALINRMGFNNAGAEALSARIDGKFAVPIGVNIGKNKDTPNERAAEDYLACLERLYDRADFFVVNVSSPNTPGLRDLQAGGTLAALLRTLREKADALAAARPGRRRPLLFVKVSPDESDYQGIVDAAVGARFDGIVATNTTRDRSGLPPGAPAEGGLSGAPLKARSTEIVRDLSRRAGGRLAIIAAGGVFTPEDAYEKILAGASLVEVYTGFVYEGPGMVRRLSRRLGKLLARGGFANVAEARGYSAQ